MQNQVHDTIKELKIITSLWNEYYCYTGTKNWTHLPDKQSYKKGEVFRLDWLHLHFKNKLFKNIVVNCSQWKQRVAE